MSACTILFHVPILYKYNSSSQKKIKLFYTGG